MTLRQLQQAIGQIQAEASRLARRLELADRALEAAIGMEAAELRSMTITFRLKLSALYTRLHALEARLPTPELLSEAAFKRALALGLQTEAAEAERTQVYRRTMAEPHARQLPVWAPPVPGKNRCLAKAIAKFYAA